MITLGIDIGSTACKAVIMKDGEDILSKSLIALGTGTGGAKKAVANVLDNVGLSTSDLDYTIATGYGRLIYKEADTQKSELICHAKGMHMLLPDVRTIIDIGGQDVKVLSLAANGSLLNFVMNDKCAAGTGRFLDVMASILDITVDQLEDLDSRAETVVNISNTCTVFAESEVISKLSSDTRVEDIVAGIHASVAKRVAGLARRVGIVQEVGMSGGVALNNGVVKALSNELQTKITVHDNCQFAGAIGASLLAYNELKKARES